MNPLSVRISEDNQSFLNHMTNLGRTKTEVINDALNFLRKAQLRNELTDMATNNSEEDISLAEEGMADYLTLLDNAA